MVRRRLSRSSDVGVNGAVVPHDLAAALALALRSPRLSPLRAARMRATLLLRVRGERRRGMAG